MDIITKILSHVNFSSKFILAAMPLNSRAAGQTPRETNASGEEFPARPLVCECDSQYEGNPFREKYFCPTAKPRGKNDLTRFAPPGANSARPF